jgi:hypothetical protein
VRLRGALRSPWFPAVLAGVVSLLVLVTVIALAAKGDSGGGGGRAAASTETRARRSTTTTTAPAASSTSTTAAPGPTSTTAPPPAPSTPATAPPEPPVDQVVQVAEDPGACRYDPDQESLVDAGTVTNRGQEAVVAEVDVSFVAADGQEIDSDSYLTSLEPGQSDRWDVSGIVDDPDAPPAGFRCVVSVS